MRRPFSFITSCPRLLTSSRSIRRALSINLKAPSHIKLLNMAPNSSPEAWKTAPPYREPSQATAADGTFRKKLKGTCHCGNVVYWLRDDKPEKTKYCHCTDCQVMHGAPFQWAAIFHKEDMAFESGVHGLKFYNSSSKRTNHDLPCKVSCAYCGSWIMDEGRNMVLLFPTLLKFESEAQKKQFDPECHLFYTSRVVDILDGKVKWEGLDEKSEQVPERAE